MVGTELSPSTFIETPISNIANIPGEGAVPELLLIHAYKFEGSTVAITTVDSVLTYHRLSSDWIYQPGGNFFAVALVDSGYYDLPDSLRMYTMNTLSGGGVKFKGFPEIAVVNQKTYNDGMGNNSTYTYSFDDGVINRFEDPEFSLVDETLPGSNGSIRSFYDVDTVVNGIENISLDGLEYNTRDLESGGSLVGETKKTWDAIPVDALHGVYDDELTMNIVTRDDVPDTTSYAYDGSFGDYPLHSRTEFGNNDDERIDITTHPEDYSGVSGSDPGMAGTLYSMDTSNDVSPVIEHVVESVSGGNTTVVSSDITEYSVFSLGQIMPSATLRLSSASPVPGSQFQFSFIGGSGTFEVDPKYVTWHTFNSYDAFGKLLEETDGNGIKTNYEYGYDHAALMGEVKNSNGTPCFMDDFNDGSITDGDPFSWSANTIYAGYGRDSVTDGALALAAQYGGDYAMNENAEFQNFTADVRLKVVNDYGRPQYWGSIHFGSDTADFHTGYTVYVTDNGYIILLQGSNGQQLQSVYTGLIPNVWRRLSVTVDGTNVKAYIDGVLYINCTLTSSPAEGYVGLLAYGSDLHFDDFRCYPQTGLASSYGYDPVTLEVTNTNGPNNVPTYYSYDGFGRLTATRDEQGNLLSDNSYYYSRTANNEFNTLVPNYIQTVSYRSAADSTVTKTYLDGLGRKIEKEISAGGGNDIVTYTYYDSLDRVTRVYKPFEHVSYEGFFPDTNGNVRATDTNYYNESVYSGFSDNYPYTENIYYKSPLDRLEDMVPPGYPWQSRPVRRSKGSNLSSLTLTIGSPTYPQHSLYKTTVTDENLVKKLEYRDKFGNLVETVADSGGENLRTDFKYNVMGNLLESVSPQKLVTSYSYNTLGELTSKTTPDAGTTRYLYDKAGNLRLIEDANHSTPFSKTFDVNTPNSASGTFTLTSPGAVTISAGEIQVASGTSCTFSLKRHGGSSVITSDTATGQEPVTSTIALEVGVYDYVATTTGTSSEYACSINSAGSIEFKQYDALNRITTVGDVSDVSSFTQANADTEGFPEAGRWNYKLYYYDAPSNNSLAAGQQNLIGHISYTYSYLDGNPVNRTFYSYDSMGRIEWVVQTVLDLFPEKLTYSYDRQGNITRKGFTDLDNGVSMYTIYTYNSAGRLSGVYDSSAAFRVLVPDGIPRTGFLLSSEVQKRNAIVGGVVMIVLGVAVLLV